MAGGSEESWDFFSLLRLRVAGNLANFSLSRLKRTIFKAENIFKTESKSSEAYFFEAQEDL